MLQKPPNELLGWQRAGFRFLRITNPVAEHHLVVDDADDPVIAERDAKDVGRKVLECLFWLPLTSAAL